MCNNSHDLNKQILELFNKYFEGKFIFNQDNLEFEKTIINEYSRNNRKNMMIKVFFEKDKDANPYYSSNDKLNKCSQLLHEICDLHMGKDIPDKETNIINEIYQLMFNDTTDNTLEEKINYINKVSEDCIKSITYYLTNNIVIIKRWAGGFRSTIDNDCEFEAELSLFDSIDTVETEKLLDNLCQKYGAKWEYL